MKTPTIWLITDTHFGHDAMVEYCGRPKDHSERILTNLAEMVKPGDTLIHLGDFCIGDDSNWIRRFVQAAPNVNRILVRGNHDHKSDTWYVSNGFHFVCEALVKTCFGKKVLFTHIPKRKDSDYFNFNIHGHFHNTLHRLLREEYVVEGEKERNDKDFPLRLYEQNYHKLLAIENTELKPVKLEKFLTDI